MKDFYLIENQPRGKIFQRADVENTVAAAVTRPTPPDSRLFWAVAILGGGGFLLYALFKRSAR